MKEAKLIKEVMCKEIDDKTIFDNLLDKHDYWKFIRITTWVKRFITNCKGKTKSSGLLATEETNKSIKFIIKGVQKQSFASEKILTDQQTLNLQENTNGTLECRSRITGNYPIYLPRSSSLSKKIVQEAHKKTLHGGTTLTAAEVRIKYWIPKLRQFTKQVTRHCYGCKQHHLKAYSVRQQGQLSTGKTVSERAFEVNGTNFSEIIYYKTKKSKENKSYIILFTCSLTRAVHLELLPDQTTTNS